MADYVEVRGRVVELPRECEHDAAARAAFIEKLTAEKPKASKSEEK